MEEDARLNCNWLRDDTVLYRWVDSRHQVLGDCSMHHIGCIGLSEAIERPGSAPAAQMLNKRHSTIDVELNSVHEASVVGGKEMGCSSQFLWSPKPAGRYRSG